MQRSPPSLSKLQESIRILVESAKQGKAPPDKERKLLEKAVETLKEATQITQTLGRLKTVSTNFKYGIEMDDHGREINLDSADSSVKLKRENSIKNFKKYTDSLLQTVEQILKISVPLIRGRAAVIMEVIKRLDELVEFMNWRIKDLLADCRTWTFSLSARRNATSALNEPPSGALLNAAANHVNVKDLCAKAVSEARSLVELAVNASQPPVPSRIFSLRARQVSATLHQLVEWAHLHCMGEEEDAIRSATADLLSAANKYAHRYSCADLSAAQAATAPVATVDDPTGLRNAIAVVADVIKRLLVKEKLAKRAKRMAVEAVSPGDTKPQRPLALRPADTAQFSEMLERLPARAEIVDITEELLEVTHTSGHGSVDHGDTLATVERRRATDGPVFGELVAGGGDNTATAVGASTVDFEPIDEEDFEAFTEPVESAASDKLIDNAESPSGPSLSSTVTASFPPLPSAAAAIGRRKFPVPSKPLPMTPSTAPTNREPLPRQFRRSLKQRASRVLSSLLMQVDAPIPTASQDSAKNAAVPSSALSTVKNIPGIVERGDSEKLRERQQLIGRFLQAETAYFTSLKTLVVLFIEPLRKEWVITAAANRQLSRHEKRLFEMLEAYVALADLSKTVMLDELMKVAGTESIATPPGREPAVAVTAARFGEVAMKLTVLLGQFRQYVDVLEDGLAGLEAIVGGAVGHVAAAEMARRVEIFCFQAKVPKLASYLQLPVARLAAYERSIDSVLRLTPCGHPDEPDLVRVVSKLKEVFALAMQHREEGNKRRRVAAAIRRIDFEGNPLAAPLLNRESDEAVERRLIREGALYDVASARKRKLYYYFVFSDVMVQTVKKDTPAGPHGGTADFHHYKCIDIIPLKRAVLKTSVGANEGDELNLAFHIAVVPPSAEKVEFGASQSKIFKFWCLSDEEKRQWLKDLSPLVHVTISKENR